MAVFLSTLNQMGFLFLLIVIGFIVSKLSIVDESASKLLSKLENNVFIPALVLGTFMNNFTLQNIGSAGKFILCGAVVVIVNIPIAVLCAKLSSKDNYIRNIYIYGLAFPNFGFMGNAVVAAIFPDVFMEYLIFVLPFWFSIYIWGVPALLIPGDNEKKTLLSRLKPFLNPMFVALLIGAVMGVTSVPVPAFFSSAVTTLGDCMSPIAMLIIGMTVAKIDLAKVLKNISIYVITFIKLIIIPILFVVAVWLLKLPYELAICTVCASAMPLGLNTIVVPSAYGKDTSFASGIVLVSHVLSCITIPLMFFIFDFLTKV